MPNQVAQMSVPEVNAKRKLDFVGGEGVICDIPCQGNNIGAEQSQVSGYRDVEMVGRTYRAAVCGLCDKFCLVGEVALLKQMSK